MKDKDCFVRCNEDIVKQGLCSCQNDAFIKLKFQKPKKKKNTKFYGKELDSLNFTPIGDKCLDGEKYNFMYFDELGMTQSADLVNRHKVNKDKLKRND